MTISLPHNWNAKRVKHVTHLVTSGSRGWAEFYADDGPLFIRIGNLTERGIDLDLADLQHVRLPVGAEGARTRVKQGDVLVSITALIGAVGLVRHAIGESYVNQHLALVRPTSIVDARWLAYALRSQLCRDQFMLRMYGGTKGGLGLDDVREVSIPLPPRQVQRVLADFLDRKTEAIDAIISKKERLLELLQEKRHALIEEQVTQGVLGDTKWKRTRLGHVLRRVKRPVQVAPHETYREIGIRSHGKGIFHKDPVLGSWLGEKQVFWIKPGDLVFNIVFAWERAVAVAGQSEEGFIGSHRFPTYRAITSMVHLPYLMRFFSSRFGQDYLERNSPGAAGRNKTLDQFALLKEEVPLPDLASQQRIAEFLQEAEAHGLALEQRLTAQLALLSEYRQGVITEAVAGKIAVSHEAAQ